MNNNQQPTNQPKPTFPPPPAVEDPPINVEHELQSEASNEINERVAQNAGKTQSQKPEVSSNVAKTVEEAPAPGGEQAP